MKILRLAFKSLLHRRFATGMTMLSIALSIALLLGVERVRQSGRDAFGGAISKTDLIVGPRTGNLALLLYSVFRIGSPAQNVSMKSVSAFAKHPAVEWVVPFSLGDGYRGFPVVATNADFYDRFKYGNGQSLTFASGNKGSGYFDVVLGATAARTLQHKLGDKIVVSHGHSEDGDGFVKHEEYPFTVSGILAFTGTPVDKTVWITLHAMAAIHEEPDNDHEGHDDHEKEDHHTGDSHDHEDHDDDDHEKEEHQHPHSDQVSGFYLGAKDRTATLGLMREINEFKNEPLLAIMPAVVINDLWRSLAVGETALALVSAMVAVVGICGMWVSLHLLVHGRRREMSILRAAGASPKTIIGLMVGEAVLICIGGIVLGVVLLYGAMIVLMPLIEHKYGLALSLLSPTGTEWFYIAAMILASMVAGFFPALRAYRNALNDGLATKL